MAGRVILYLSRRFVTICFVTNNSCLLKSRCHLAESQAATGRGAFRARAVTNHCLHGSLQLRIPLQQFDL